MAACTHGVSTPSTSNATSYVSGAFTPVANDLLVVFVAATATVAAGTMTGTGGVGFINTGILATWNTGANTIYVFVADALAAASSQTVTFDCTGDGATGCVIEVVRVSGMTRTGNSAVRQNQSANDQAASTTPSVTFGSACLTGNPTLGVVGNSTNPAALTTPTNWTERDDTGYGTPTTGTEYVTRDSGFTGTAMTWGSTSASIYGVIGIELDTSGLALHMLAMAGVGQ